MFLFIHYVSPPLCVAPTLPPVRSRYLLSSKRTLFPLILSTESTYEKNIPTVQQDLSSGGGPAALIQALASSKHSSSVKSSAFLPSFWNTFNSAIISGGVNIKKIQTKIKNED